MASAVMALPPNPPPPPPPVHLGYLAFPQHVSVCPLGTLLSTLNGFGKKNNPRPGGGGEFRTGFAPFLNFLGFVNGSQTLNAILMQLFCV